MEIRSISDNLELRVEDGAAGPVLSAYGVLYDRETVIGGRFREVVRPGAFADVMAADVRGLFNHDASQILGRTASGTMRLADDSRGLKYTIDLDDQALSVDLAKKIRRGDVSGSSFSFTVSGDDDDPGERWTEGGDTAELPLRELRRMNLFDVGPVTFPAYEATNGHMSVRAASDMVAQHINPRRRRAVPWWRLRLAAASI